MMFGPLLRREFLDLWRSRRVVFLPLAFALLAGLEPVGMKMLPGLMRSGGNLPPGTVIRIPTPPPAVVAGLGLGQIGQIGVLLVVLVAMGAVAGEGQSGVLASVLSRPVSRPAFIGAKAASLGVLAALSLLLGMAASVYETTALFGSVPAGRALLAALAYLPALLLPLAATLAASALLKSPLAAGGSALVLTLVLETLPRYLGASLRGYSPGDLLAGAQGVLQGTQVPGLLHQVATALALTLLLLALGAFWLERREV